MIAALTIALLAHTGNPPPTYATVHPAPEPDGDGLIQLFAPAISITDDDIHGYILSNMVPSFIHTGAQGTLNIVKIDCGSQSYSGVVDGTIPEGADIEFSPHLHFVFSFPEGGPQDYESVSNFNQCRQVFDEPGPFVAEWDECHASSYHGVGGSWTPLVEFDDWPILGIFIVHHGMVNHGAELDGPIELRCAATWILGYDYYPDDQDSNGYVDFNDLLKLFANWNDTNVDPTKILLSMLSNWSTP